MSHRRMAVIVTGLTLTLGVGLARAQIVVTDSALTLRTQAVAALKNRVINTLGQEAERIQRMAARLSASTNLDRYSLTDVPMWRIHLFQSEQFLYANSFNAALNYGDGPGAGYEEVARPRQAPSAELAGLAMLAP